MKRRTTRLYKYIILVCCMGVGVTLLLRAFNDNIVFFVTPSELLHKTDSSLSNIRLGGLVKPGSVTKAPDGLTILFIITDHTHEVPVAFKGIPPALFRENKGIVVRGAYGAKSDQKIFHAKEMLAKHDENYEPPKIKKMG